MRKIVLTGLVSLAAASILGGCASGSHSLANESQQSVQSKLVRGKTTQSDVVQMFGEPMHKSNRKGSEVWLYALTQTSAKTYVPFLPMVTGDYGGTTRNLEITFIKGVVSDFEYGEGKV